MKNILLFLLLGIITFLQACKVCNPSIDEIIEKYDKTDFGSLKNKSIYFRSRGHSLNSSVYFINAFGGACSPYVVEFNHKTSNIIEIKNNLVISSCGRDYLSREEIEKSMIKFKEYGFCLLQVDKMGNVFINPNSQDVPIFLRKAFASTPLDIDKYKIYKDNWYIRK